MLTRFIERLLDARKIPEIREIFITGVNSFGFDHALYAAYFMLTVPQALVRERPVILMNLPDALLAKAQQLGPFEQDPWVQWVLDHDGDISAHDLQRQRRSPSLELATRHGFGAAHIVSLRHKVLHSAGGVILLPGHGADQERLEHLWDKAGRDLRVLCWVMHMRVATMHRKAVAATLTPRQREVLGWRSAGKTVSEIATILGITPATVEKHMRLAREALGVETTPQAVLKAHVTNQLFQPGAPGLPLSRRPPTFGG
ncbi:helix-turn-helix transcriptional regulator [Paracoccus beibuensis]|uniref:helix-turn-helix transcriptional regulator n=1 Tax=Paracoccus beibuensis TaxID=547602 RepID=UPI002240A601|nr:LuxR family transcriptional regulator [Paracoccus beibuensis]